MSEDDNINKQFADLKQTLDQLQEQQLQHISQLSQKKLLKPLLLYSVLPLIIAIGLFLYFEYFHWIIITLCVLALINALGALFFKLFALPKLIQAEAQLKNLRSQE